MSSSQSSEMLEAALNLARQGLKIFPCHFPVFRPDKPPLCSCRNPDCKSLGKHPRETGWRHTATNDQSEVERVWRAWPNSNIAILTGEPNGFDVLDVDPKHAGDLALLELEDENEPLPPTIRVKTGSGGQHIFFTHTPGIRNNNDGGIKTGIDLKTTGGYVIGPPSQHASGLKYQWLDTQNTIAHPPEWLVDIFYKMFTDKSSPTKRKRIPVEHWNALAFGVTAGDRHNAIAQVAGLLLNSKDLKSKHLAIALVHGYNQVCCDPPKTQKEVNKIIRWIAEQR